MESAGQIALVTWFNMNDKNANNSIRIARRHLIFLFLYEDNLVVITHTFKKKSLCNKGSSYPT